MSRSQNRVWIHLVWAVKYRSPLLFADAVSGLNKFIPEHFSESKINIVAVNGYKDHYHVLFKPSLDIAISKSVKDIKGSSSHWLGQSQLTTAAFTWQRGYSASSVSPWDVSKIANYIKNQRDHHEGRNSFRP